MAKISLAAKKENLSAVLDFVKHYAEGLGFDKKLTNQVLVAVEEAVINVVNYAYPAGAGEIEVVSIQREDKGLEIEVTDSGIAFDPLAKEAPDTNVPLEERKIGGLGIYLMRKIMNSLSYRRQDDKNILTMVVYKKEEGADGVAGQEDTSAQWPLAYMKREEYKKGELLFKKGDKAEKMFYIKKGAIRLVEMNIVIRENQVIGEMGLFSPFKERTASAVCDEDLEVYTMGKEEVIKFFGEDPQLALNLMQISIKRFIENLKRETEAKERIESELRIARDIQTSMLPRKFPPFADRKEFEIYAMMDPAKEVGGDFYDFFFIDKNKLYFVIGDVSGKGVPAALFMAITKTVLKTEAMRGLPPEETVRRVNDILCPDNQTCMFVTIFCVMLDTETGEIQFTNGGHTTPLVCVNKGEFDFVEIPRGFVVGAIEGAECGNGKMTLNPGDTIFLYTDGVSEAMNPAHQLFSESRLKECLAGSADKGLIEIVTSVRKSISDYAQDAPQSDDITMLVLKYKGKEGGV